MHPLVSAETLAGHLDDPRWVVFDCRHDLMAPTAGIDAYRAGHLRGARFASLDQDLSGEKDGSRGRHPLPTSEAFVDFLARSGVTDDSVVIAYDAGNSLFASRLWWLVRWIGHANAAVLDGGLAAWQAADLPITTEIPDTVRGDVSIGEPLVTSVDTVTVEANLAAQKLLVVDARAPERYRGDVEPLDPVAGHIPGAVNHPMGRSLAADGRFKDATTLRAEFDRVARRIAMQQHGGAVVRLGRDRLPQPARDGGRGSDRCVALCRVVECVVLRSTASGGAGRLKRQSVDPAVEHDDDQRRRSAISHRLPQRIATTRRPCGSRRCICGTRSDSEM